MNTTRQRRGLALVRDVSFLVAIGLLTFQGLRRGVGDYYRVPSDSMQPLLHGEPEGGDVVFVRSFDRAAAQRRGDLVVVQHPDDPGALLVKRLAARGDDRQACSVDLREGDLWLGPDAHRVRRDVKEPLAAGAQSVTWAQWPGSAIATEGLELSVAARRHGRLLLAPLSLSPVDLRQWCRARVDGSASGSVPPGTIGTAGAVDASYLTVTGGRGREGEDVEVYDCGLEVELVSAPGILACGLQTHHATFTLLWTPVTGRIELWCDGETVEQAELSPQPGPHRFGFGHLDGRLFFVLDGAVPGQFCVPMRPEWKRSRSGNQLPRGPHRQLWLGVLGEGEADLCAVRVQRDIYYYHDRVIGAGWPVTVPAGEWFLLGDNAFDSRDSRFFGSVSAATYVGRPWFVLGPSPRRRWLMR